MYKLLIVDDEETIREGLCDIVDWKAMGYEVVQTLDDGKEAIEYISKNHVDVILTDIKMTFISGLELAKYIQINCPQVKVVIISGHQEFELAREAMGYNVKYYLLKPTRLDELNRVFMELKSELDQELIKKENYKRKSEENNMFRNMLQEQFFTDLIMGALPNKYDIDKRVKNIGLDINPSLCKICVVNLNLSYNGNKLPCNLEDESESLYSALKKYVSHHEENLYFYTIYNTFRNIKLLAITSDSIDNAVLSSAVMKFIDKVAEKVKLIMGITILGKIERIFDSMYDTAINFKPVVKNVYSEKSEIKDAISESDYSLLISQQKLLVSYLNSGDTQMAVNLFENMLSELTMINEEVVYDWILSLFATVKNDLSELGIDIQDKIINYKAVLKLKDISEIKQWGCSIVKKIGELVQNNKILSEKVVIQKAKKFIKGNYFKDIGLEEVAGSVYLSSIYFSRLFKQQTNENFSDYLLKVRMHEAIELLKDPRLKIYEVSVRVGYKNTKYFYKLFKEFTGSTPVEYREYILKKGE